MWVSGFDTRKNTRFHVGLQRTNPDANEH
jgi:hypothetical protein